MKRFSTLIASMFVVGAGAVSAQLPYTPEVGISHQKQARDMFEQRNYVGCLSQLQISTKDKNVFSDSDAAFMRAASALELNAPDAGELMESFLKDYPQSENRGRALYLQGSYKINQKEYAEAISLLEQAGDSWLFKSEQAICYYKLAYCFLETGQIDAAKGLYTQLSSDANFYMAADYYLAYISYLEKDYNKALKGFMPLMNMPQYSDVVPFYVAQIYFINGNYEKAIEYARKLSAGTNTDVESRAEMLRLIGESYYYMGNGSKAISTLREYIALTKRPTRSAFYALGLSEYEAGDYRAAIQSLSKCTATQDVYAQTAYYYLALSYLKIGETGNARMAFEVASKMNFDQKVKEMAMYNYALTVYQTAFSPFNESVTAFEAFLNTYPNSVYADQASSYLVDVYMTTKNYLGALQSIQKIAKPGPKILAAKQRILFYLGTEEVVNADYQKAIKLFTESIDLGNYNAEIRAEAAYWRGESYYRLEEYPQAISNFQRFLNETTQRNQPVYALALYNLGYAYFKSYDFAKAKNAFERYIYAAKDKQSALYADALNRLGDCQYYRREFNAAEKSYASAAQTQGGSADYALFQKATMQGIQRQQVQKIETLNQLLANYPKSEYIDDALLERGKASIQMNNYAGAISDFKRIIKDFNASNLAPTAAIQLSLAYRNTNKQEDALESYRYILKNFPGSDEAKVANADLKSMYQDLNRIDEYAKYVNSLGGAFTFSATEQDSLTYLAAEQTYLKGDNIKGEQSFIKYLQSFPEGAFVLDANYNLGVITLRTSKDVAERYFTKVISFPNNKYTEDALFELGTIHLGRKDYDKAYQMFKDLSVVATKKTLQLKAKEGMLRSAVGQNNHEEVILVANTIINESGVSHELQSETLYLRAKSLKALGQDAYALNDYKELAKDTRSVYGAEAKYNVALSYFEKGDNENAEKELFEFIDQGTPHQYWLAKGFILLSDVYVKKKDDFQAKQYLLSLKNNYKTKDELQQQIEERLQKIQSREKNQTR